MTKAMHRIQRKNKFLPYLLILPSMLLFSMFTFYPFLKTIALSFFLTDKRGNPTKWAGISNWVRVLSKETFWKVIAITLEIAGINLVFTFGLAIFFALLSSQKKKGGKLYQTMYALPMAIASSPAAAIFLFIFRQKNGVINSLLGGANIGWTTEIDIHRYSIAEHTDALIDKGDTVPVAQQIDLSERSTQSALGLFPIFFFHKNTPSSLCICRGLRPAPIRAAALRCGHLPAGVLLN